VFLLAYISSTKKWYYFIFSFFYNATVRVLSQPRRPLIGTYIPVYGGGGVPVVFEKKKSTTSVCSYCVLYSYSIPISYCYYTTSLWRW